jgi:gas vesicle protein
MRRSDSWTNFAFGLGFGLVTGVVLALLVAPKSGQESRDFVKDRVSNASDRLKEVTADRKKVYTRTWQKGKIKPNSNEFKSTH